MKVERLLWIVASIVMILYIFIIQPNQSNDIWMRDKYDSNITVENVRVDEDQTITYTYNTKEDLKASDTIMILRNHVELKISVEEQLVLEVRANSDSNTKTTGKDWSIFHLKDEYLNKQIHIEVKPIYDSHGNVTIYKGNMKAVLKHVFINDIVETLITCILIFMSIVLLVIGDSGIDSKGRDNGLYYLGAMALSVAGWRLGEINTLRLILPYDVLWSNISYICLSFIPLTFTLYFRTGISSVWRNVINAYCIMSMGSIILQFILQLTGCLDYSESLEITHVIIISLIIIVGSTYIAKQNQEEYNKFQKISKMIFLTMCGISLLSLIIYDITGKNTNIIAIIVVFYIITLAIYNIDQIRKESLKNNQVDVYKQLAFVDEMTGLYNRTALEHDLRLYNRRKIESLTGLDPFVNLVAIVIDLNDLKACNDEYGHDKGDMYIKNVAEVINSIFVDNSKCYRMGGDEFCVIVKEAISIKINKKINELKYQVDRLNDANNVFVYGMAIGYAQYNDELDHLMEDILKRADENMYSHKRFIKDIDVTPKRVLYTKD